MESEQVNQTLDRTQLMEQFFREISRNSTWTVMFHQAASLRLGLNPTDVKCVGLLQETGPIPAGELAALTGLTTGAVTGVIDRLEKAGLVRRVADPADRRRVIIEPVANARHSAEAAQTYAPLGEATARLLATYSDAELRIILDFVRRGADLMKAQTARVLETA